MKETRVRYAPSPTGDPHIGNLRSAIFNWLHAKNQNGKFILRIEDTDQSRMVKDGIQKQKDALLWLGMKWDEIYIQSERLDIYSKYSEKLIEEDKAYRCFATAEELEELRNRQKSEGKITRYDGRYRDYDKKKSFGFTNNPKYFGKKSDEVVEKDDKRSSFKGRKKFKKRQRPKKFSFKKHKKK